MNVKKILRNFLGKYAPGLYNGIVRFRLVARAYLRYGMNIRILRLFWNIQPYTMLGHVRLLSTYDIAEKVIQEKINGAFVECGVWKGGCSAMMAAIGYYNGEERDIWMFDSFEGLPEPTEEDGKRAAMFAKQNTEGRLVPIQVCVASEKDVERLVFQILALPRKNINIVKGWFQEILPEQNQSIGTIAVLRLDGDWYESTKCILDNLYDQVVEGGYIMIDDYSSWEGCKKATDEFFLHRGISPELHWIDESCVYLRKP